MTFPRTISLSRNMLALLLAGCISPLPSLAQTGAAQVAAPVQSRTIEVTIDEGTGFTLTASTGDSLVMELQGALWKLPKNGGRAQRIVDGLFEAKRPSLSPDGKQIVAQSFADGLWHLWIFDVDGGNRRQLTRGQHQDTQPRWSPDGKQIAFITDRAGGNALWLLDVASGEQKPLSKQPGNYQDPNWSADGKQLLFVQSNAIKAWDMATGATRTLAGGQLGGSPTVPSLSPDGSQVAYVAGGMQSAKLMVVDVAKGADGKEAKARSVAEFNEVFPSAPIWLSKDELLYAANGKIRATQLKEQRTRTVDFSATLNLTRAVYPRKAYDFDSTRLQAVKGIAAPALSPDGKQIVFQALNDLWLLSMDNKQPRRLSQDGFYESDPVWSHDGKRIAYASDKPGTAQLHVMELATGKVTQVSREPGAATAPAWSPDDKLLAFQTETFETRILDLAAGSSRKLLGAADNDNPSRPSWSADGKTLTMTFANAGRNQILMVDVATGNKRWHEPAPYRSISTRGDDGPVWSPDGRWLAFSMGSTIWAMPVNAAGEPTGTAQQLTTEASDAPSWSGDSKQILYLNNGRLKQVSLTDKAIRPVPLELNWSAKVPQQRMLIQAGALWDGVSPEVRKRVDILVVNNRIASITRHDPNRKADPTLHVINASQHTITPGLFEAHNHQQMRSKFLGDRQGRHWLAYGITSTRSTGDPVYRGIEDRESLAAGARIGPRLFTTGEMLDGSRLLWSFSRPVEDEDQLKLELTRIKALDYDVIKTYMNFRSSWQARVADWGHREMGISTTSHDVFPGVGNGVDGVEHFVGPNRWGGGFFPHLYSGNVYKDILLALAKSKIQMTTTNFAGRASLPSIKGLLDDARLKTLYPPWEYKTLKATHDCAAKTGPCNFFLTPNDEASHLTVADFKTIKREGGVIMVGSDAPLDSYVVSTFQNLVSLQQHGYTAFEALQSVTMIPAQAQGVARDLGSIEVGKLADLVFVTGEPAKNIADLMSVQAVMKAGEYYRVDELMRPFSP